MSAEQLSGDSLIINPSPLLASDADEVNTKETAAEALAEQNAAPGKAAPAALVASHYNSIPEMGIQLRNDSRILHLRNMNNWMKSQLIGDFIERLDNEGCSRARILDLACGKGGDLRKWRIGNIGQIVMTDVAEVSLQDCRDRYQKLSDRRTGRLPFRANFIHADLTQVDLTELLPLDAPRQFDLASCQFSLHYSFRSEEWARRWIKNCTQMLRPGGYFIGTVTNADAIMHYLRTNNGHFANQICSVSAQFPLDQDQSPPPLFGAEIQFQLEGVVNCPEFLCHFPLLERLLQEQGMELVYSLDFPDAIDHFLNTRGREALDLMRRMDVLEMVEAGRLEGRDADEYGPAIAKLGPQGDDRSARQDNVGTISKSEWEVVTMYKVFAFRKRDEGSKQKTDEGEGRKQGREENQLVSS